MSVHIGAKSGDVAKTVLLPGDPLRAKHIAENHLQDAVCYNEVRGMYGFTGIHDGKRVSVQGTGMGIPSAAIYINELITHFDATTLMRIGTCGALQPDMKLGDVLLITAASTDSAFNKQRFGHDSYAPAADFGLLRQAYDAAQALSLPVRVGTVFSTDTFYYEDPDYWKIWADYGVLCIEMETAALYTLAAKHGVRALSILTVSDVILTGATATSMQRQTAYMDMVRIALQIAE